MVIRKLYEQIADSIRDEIYAGRLSAGDSLPTVRDMADQWNCAPGTVQRAYRDLVEEGLITSVTGQGTRVAQQTISEPLRQLRLVTEIESQLITLMEAGYTLSQIEGALWSALDHLRERERRLKAKPPVLLHFAGSHDPALSLASAMIAGDFPIEMTFAGSLNGLLQVASGEADIAGCHLWDSATQDYNTAYIRRLLGGREIAVLTVADRHLGLMTAPDNPHDIHTLEDLPRAGVRFINRQAGAGTRLWLDEQLARRGIPIAAINGYDQVVYTHVAVAQAVASGKADVALGVEAAAQTYGLHFIPLTTERYDLVIPAETWQSDSLQALVRCLQLESTRRAIHALGGYDTSVTGTLAWVS